MAAAGGASGRGAAAGHAAAPHGTTGPTRHAGLTLADLVVAAPPGATLGARAASDSHLEAPLLRPAGAASAKAAALQVAAALHSVNLFSRPVVIDDALTVARGRVKTRLFAVAFVVTVVVLVVLNAVQSQTFRKEYDWPDWPTYAGILGYAPTCPCSNPYVTLGDVVSYYVPDASNFTVNFCAGLAATFLACRANQSTTATGVRVAGCSSNDAGALLWGAYLQPFAASCLILGENFADVFDNVAHVPVGAVLPINSTFQALATASALNELRLFMLTVSTLMEPLTTMSIVALASSVELTAGAKVTVPANCTCAPQPSPSRQFLQPCSFQPAFDPQPPSPSRAIFGCNAAFDSYQFPMPMLADPALYRDVLVLPPPYEQYTVGAELVSPNATTFASFFQDTLDAFFPSFGIAGSDTGHLVPGFLTADYMRLYAACAPSSCTYVVSARPTPLQVLTTLLGVLSGVQTVLTLAIDRGYDAAAGCAQRRRRAAPPAPGADAPEDVADDGTAL